MEKPLRIGLAGANYGLRLSAGFAKRDDARVHAVAEADAGPLEAAGRQHPGAKLHSSLDSLLEAEDIDALIVATPTHLHERHSLAAIDHGAHVLCACPAGARESEVSHMSAAAGLAGKVFMLANPLRYDPRFAKARELISAQAHGEALFATATIHLPSRSPTAQPWRFERDHGGGALLEAGAPALDALWAAFGSIDPMEAAAARYDSYSKEGGAQLEHPAEDSICGFVRLKNGRSLILSARVSNSVSDLSLLQQLRIDTAGATFDLLAGRLHPFDAQAARYAEEASEQAQCEAIAENFLRAVSNEAPYPDGKTALSLQRMMDGLLKSSREREAIALKVERSLDDLFEGL